MAEQGQEQQDEQTEAEDQTQEQTQTEGEAQDEGQPGGQRSKAEMDLRRRTNKLEKQNQELHQKLDQLLQQGQSQPQESGVGTQAEQAAAQKVLDGDPNDMPTKGDLEKAFAFAQKQQGQGLPKEAQEKLDRLEQLVQRQNQEREGEKFWTQFYKKHPNLDAETADTLLDQAREEAEGLGFDENDPRFQGALTSEFYKLAQREDQRRKRSEAQKQKTKQEAQATSPDTSTEGTQTSKGTSSDQAPDEKPESSYDLLLRWQKEGSLVKGNE